MSRKKEDVLKFFAGANAKGDLRECMTMEVLLEIRDRLDKLETLEEISRALDRIHTELETIRLRPK